MSGERGGYGGGRRGGGRGGRGPGDGGRSRGGGGRGGYAPSPRSQESSIPSASYRPLPARSSAIADAPSSSSITEELQQLTIVEPAKDQALPSAAAPASSKGLRHPARPGFGTVGRNCVVRANHFLVEVADNTLYHYDVSITPESVSRVTNRKIISELVKLHKDKALGRRMPAYDGRKSLRTAGAFPFESKEFTVSLPENDGRKAKEFRVIIKIAGNTSIHNLKEFLAGRQIEAPQEVIQALDIVLRESPSIKYTSVARSFFSPSFGHQASIGEGLECWRGYYQSLRPTQMGLSLNIDISATSFYKPMNIVEFVIEYLNLRDASRPLSDQDRAKVKRALRGVRVEAVHRRDLRIRYRINGLTREPLKQLTFPISETQTEISVVQYFKERYNYNLKCVSWPCLLAGSESKPTYLPMEVCAIVEGQRYSKKLNEGQVTAILRNTCQRPAERERSIREMVQLNNYNNDEFTKEFGLRMKYELTTVEARVLPPPRLMYHDSGREKSCNPSVGQWNMINKKMVNGASVDYWTCLSFSRLRQDDVFHFCEQLIGMCNNMGMVIKPPFVDFKFARADRLDAALRDVNNSSIEAFKRAGIQGKHIQLLIVILPEMKGYYGNIKRICETELGIVSQCCNPRHVSKCNKQYLENVSLKINVKSGGRNTVLEDAINRRIPLVTDIPTIIFGADVSHPAPGEDSLSSIAAVVGSIDWPHISKYRGLFSTQQHRQEIINDLYSVDQDPKKGHTSGGMIRELLLAFYRSTNHKPGRIIFYRDGVSEGQFSQVLLYEMDAIRKACASLQEGYLPPVTFIVVQKRHHTRLFPEVHGGNQGLTDRSGNILAGTVVDRKICHPTEFDFYLCSHAGIQGTSKPTHYHVLWDENNFSANALQTLTNNLCYTYARCTRSVSIVPPAYYAHLVAFRARYYMEGESSETDSGPGPSQTRDAPIPVQFFPRVKDQVKEVMFYC